MTIELRPRMIPVEESMPDDETTVLCYGRDTDTWWIGFHEEGFWWEDGNEESINVTHWMELPEVN